MSPAVIMTALKFLSSSDGKKFRTALKGGNKSVASTLLKGLGQKNVTSGDVDTFLDLVNNMEDTGLSDPAELSKHVRDIMMGRPLDYIIRGAGTAAASAVDFIGNKSVTDANRLAQAILERGRKQSALNEQLFGPSESETLDRAWANAKLRKGENIKHATDAGSKVIKDLLKEYKDRDDAARAMQASAYLNSPGSLYNYINGMQSRNARDSGGTK